MRLWLTLSVLALLLGFDSAETPKGDEDLHSGDEVIPPDEETQDNVKEEDAGTFEEKKIDEHHGIDHGPSVQLKIEPHSLAPAPAPEGLGKKVDQLKEEVHELVDRKKHEVESPDENMILQNARAMHQIHEDSMEAAEEHAAASKLRSEEAEVEGKLEATEKAAHDVDVELAKQEAEHFKGTLNAEKRLVDFGKAALDRLEHNWQVDEEDARERNHLEEEALAEQGQTGHIDDTSDDVQSLVNDVEAAHDDLQAELDDITADEEVHLRQHQASHQLAVDCPEGWIPRAHSADPDDQDLEVEVEVEQDLQPCPVAYLAAPCPCVQMAFEGATTPPPVETTEAESDEQPEESETEPEPLAEVKPHDAEGCEEVVREMKEKFGEDLSAITGEDLEGYRARLGPKFNLHLGPE